MATENHNSPSAAAFLGHAVEAFSDLLKAGVKFQESVTLWWTGTLDPLVSVRAWNRVTRSVFRGVDAAASTARRTAAAVEETAKVSAHSAEAATRHSAREVEAAVNTASSVANGHARRPAARTGKKKGANGGR